MNVFRMAGKRILQCPSLFQRVASSNFQHIRPFHQVPPMCNPIQAPVSRPQGVTMCTLIPGDGIGPELCNSVQQVFKAAGVPVEFDPCFLSDLNKNMSMSVKEVSEEITKNGIALKGELLAPLHAPEGDLKSLSMKLIQKLDLFANVVHIKSLPGVRTRHSNVDIVIVREQTEGEHLAIEHETVEGVVECFKIVTREKSRRIAKFAFDYATKLGRKKVTAVHKANIMKLGDGLFLRCCEEIAELYPKIEFGNMIIDNTAMQMVNSPHQFDVLVMQNLYGDILNNLAAGLVGGAGVVAGASYSADAVVFSPGARHTFFEAVGKDVANPTAMLLSAVDMLRHVNLQYHADIIQNSILKVLKGGKIRTKDLGGHGTATDYIRAIIANLG